MSESSDSLKGLSRKPLGVRSALVLLAIMLVPILILAVGYVCWPSMPTLPGEGFVVPEHTSAFLGWQDNLTGRVQRVPLDVLPGQSIRILVGSGKAAALMLDDAFKSALKSEQRPKPEPETGQHILKQGYGMAVVEQRILPSGGSRFHFQYMKSTSPVPRALRERERLDDVVAGATTEFDRFCALTVWVREQLPEGTPNPYPSFNALEILDMTRGGVTKAFCAQYAQVLVQSLISLGYQARYVGLQSHEVVEAWSNQYVKWVVLDPFSCCYYRRDATPLNALEIHDLVCRAATEGIKIVRLSPEVVRDRAEQLAQYTTFNVSMVNNHPELGGSGIADVNAMWRRRVYWVDQYTEVLPVEDGKLRLLTSFESDIYFNINTVRARFAPVERGVVAVSLESFTPEFDHFERTDGRGSWRRVEAGFQWRLARGTNVLKLRAVNTQGVLGPVSEVTVNYDQ